MKNRLKVWLLICLMLVVTAGPVMEPAMATNGDSGQQTEEAMPEEESMDGDSGLSKGAALTAEEEALLAEENGESEHYIKGEDIIDPVLLQEQSGWAKFYSEDGTFLDRFKLKKHQVVYNDKVIYTANEKREAAINYMNRFALIGWQIPKGKSFTYRMMPSSSVRKTIDTGKYRGVLYTQFYRNNLYTDEEQYQDVVNGLLELGVKDLPDNAVFGSDCSSSTSYAWRYALEKASGDNYLKYTTDAGNKTSYRTYIYTKDAFDRPAGKSAGNTDTYDYSNRVGYYGTVNPAGYNRDTKTVVEKLWNQAYPKRGYYYNIYAQMKPGDLIIHNYPRSSTVQMGHVRMINRVYIKTNDDGSINPDKSCVFATEQTSTIRTANLGGEAYRTTWRVDQRFSFRELKDSYYLPVSVSGDWDDFRTISFKVGEGDKTPAEITSYDCASSKLPIISQDTESKNANGRFIGWTTVKNGQRALYRKKTADGNCGYYCNRFELSDTTTAVPAGTNREVTMYAVYEKEHKWTYSVKNGVMYETCSHNCGVQHNLKISVNDTSYNGKARRTCKVTPSENWVGQGKVTYLNNVKPGKATARYSIGGKTISKKFNIYPRKVSRFSLLWRIGGFRVRWATRTQAECSGYVIRYSRYATMKNAKTIRIKKNTTATRVVDKLKRNKQYCVQIRTFKTVNGKSYYSGWSNKKWIRTR